MLFGDASLGLAWSNKHLFKKSLHYILTIHNNNTKISEIFSSYHCVQDWKKINCSYGGQVCQRMALLGNTREMSEGHIRNSSMPGSISSASLCLGKAVLHWRHQRCTCWIDKFFMKTSGTVHNLELLGKLLSLSHFLLAVLEITLQQADPQLLPWQ